MKKTVLAKSNRLNLVLLINQFQNRRWKVFLLLTAILLLLIPAAPAAAAVEGFLAKDNSGVYHQYNYEELINSYALTVMGLSNGLYEDFAAKKTVALMDSVNGYIDYRDLLDHYARALMLGETFNLAKYIASESAAKAEIPSTFNRVSLVHGQLVSMEKSFWDEAEKDAPETTSGGTKSEPSEDKEVSPDPEPEKESAVKKTPIVSASSVSLSKAQKWAESKNAHQRFIDIAPLYWEYGKKTGLCPEVLYAQSALETGFGRYTGQVPPEYNNWAGIKTGTASGDEPEDHQQFDTPEEGVRAHFNHMSAYVGLDPIGEPHDRYHLVARINWAGTVTYVEDLSGKWAPSPTYHERILNLLKDME